MPWRAASFLSIRLSDRLFRGCPDFEVVSLEDGRFGSVFCGRPMGVELGLLGFCLWMGALL